ncbi:FMN-dependent NADH-azoreductase [Metamycoplasma spumans]|uniref:FMN-dependent NADH-azoreductase n=1 Tax=Metamycoplasma spumans TaxID=92406 RepID=UPI0034DD5B55
MAKVLVLYGSPLPKEYSVSTAVLDYFVNKYKELNPNDEIITLDLNNEEMALVSQSSNNMMNTYNEELSGKYIDLLKTVDKVIMNAPMINYNVPVTIKNFFDRISVPDKTFSYKYSKSGGSIGLLDNLKVQVLATQGAPLGWYAWASHVSFLEGIWNFLGAKLNPTFLYHGVKVAPLNEKTPADLVELRKSELDELAKSF